MDKLKDDMVHHICEENKAYFKSTQIDDPELTYTERQNIVEDVLNKDHLIFLSRFGKHLKLEHLDYFRSKITVDDINDVGYYINQIEETIKNRKRDVKNRRFAALKRLTTDSDYFSETEMMARDPLLYDQLVGQYLTEAERNERDTDLDSTQTLSSILLNTAEKQHVESVRQKMEKTEDELKQNSDSDSDSEETQIKKTSGTWGEWEDKASSSGLSNKSTTRIGRKEQELLRNEFLGIMHSRFLAGEDHNFDYSEVDNNQEYDDSEEMNQDMEDAYFEEDEEENYNGRQFTLSSDDEDELDVYMNHLNELL